MNQWSSTPEYVDAMEVAALPEVDAHLLLELAHFNPYFLVKVVSPHQLPPGLMTTALQLAIVREMGSYKNVQWDYEEYTLAMQYRDPWEMPGTEWPENDWLAGFNQLVGGMDHRAILEAWLRGFPEELMLRDLGVSPQEVCNSLKKGLFEVLALSFVMEARHEQRPVMVETYLTRDDLTYEDVKGDFLVLNPRIQRYIEQLASNEVPDQGSLDHAEIKSEKFTRQAREGWGTAQVTPVVNDCGAFATSGAQCL